jgi:hypothetical protein
LFNTDRLTDGQTGITKLLVAFRNSANAPKNLCTSKMFCAMLWSDLCNESVDSVVPTWRFSSLCIHHKQYTHVHTSYTVYVQYSIICVHKSVCMYLCIYLRTRIKSRCTHSVHGLATDLVCE